MKCSEFVFDYVHLFHYKCHKTNLNGSYIDDPCGGSYIDSPNWIKKNKKATINPINKRANED